MSDCVVITGASGKIGSFLTKHFIGAGKTVIAIASRQEGLDRLGRDLYAEAVRSGQMQPLALDLTGADSAGKLTAFLDKAGLEPLGLVNNARSLEFLNTQADGSVSRGDFANEFLLDVIVPYELTLALANRSAGRLKSVVNIASMYAVVAPNSALYEGSLAHSPISYGVAKAALVQLTRELSVRLAPQVRVNAVSFGGVEGRVDEAFKARYARLCPSGRMLTDEEVFAPVAFLLGEGSSSMTGHNLVADGGWTVW